MTIDRSTYEKLERIVDNHLEKLRTERERFRELMPHDNRPPVIDDELRTKLLGFLQFRHFYREGYLVDVEWDEMTGLVEDFEDVLGDVVDAVEQFMEGLEP